jgi:hypothetical protein
VLHEPLDGAALACGIATLEHDDVPVAVRLTPLLQLQQLDLQQALLLLVLVALHPRVVRVALAPGVDGLTARNQQQFGIVVVVIADGVPVGVDVQAHRPNVSTAAKAAVTPR